MRPSVVHVELGRQQYDSLPLAVRAHVYVKPKRMRVFLRLGALMNN